MKTRHFIYLLVILFLTEVNLSSASAQMEVPDCSSNPACNSLFSQGREQSAQGNLPEALRLYKLAYEVRTDPALLFSIARVLHKQGQTSKAASYYRRFIESPLEDAAQKHKAQEYLDQLGPTAELPASPDPPAVALPLQQSDQASPLPLTSELTRRGKPVYKKWWFWVAVGGAAIAASAVTAGVFVLTRGSSPQTMFPDNTVVVPPF